MERSEISKYLKELNVLPGEQVIDITHDRLYLKFPNGNDWVKISVAALLKTIFDKEPIRSQES